MPVDGLNASAAFLLGTVYHSLGDDRRALDLLEKAYEQHDWAMVWLKVAPRWNNLRSDSRFVAILRRLNFPEITSQ